MITNGLNKRSCGQQCSFAIITKQLMNEQVKLFWNEKFYKG